MAGTFLVFANADPSKGYKGITAFIVERGDEGFRVGKRESKLGIRASSTCELILENCEIPGDRVIGEVGGRPAIVGASLGGLAGLLLLGRDAPGAACGLVLVDIVPNMEKKGTDRIASFMMANAETGFATLEEAADAVAAYNHHRDRPPSVEGLRKNLRERDGRWYWHWDPKFISPAANRGPSEINDPALLMDCAKAISEPIMLVRGRMSDVVTPEGAAAFVDEVPTAEFVDVSEAGHMVAGDRNDAFTDAVVRFLDAL